MPSWGHLYLGWNEPAIAPLGEAVPNTELFRRLSSALGFTEPELFATDDELLDAALHRLLGRRSVPLCAPTASSGCPSRRICAPSRRAASQHPTGRRVWPCRATSRPREGPGGDPELTSGFPLVLLTTKSHTRFLNTSYSHLPKHGPAEGAPRLQISPPDAAARDLADGEEVRVWNDRGEVLVTAQVSTAYGLVW